MRAVPLFSSSILKVREVLCDERRGTSHLDEYTQSPSIAIPLRGCFAVDRGRQSVLADPNIAIFFEAGVPYRVAHPTDGGDVSFVIECESAAAADAFGNGARRDAESRPFRSTHAFAEAGVQLNARLLRRALSATADPLHVEERAFTIVASLAGSRLPDATSAVHAKVGVARAYLNEHFREQLSLGEVACEVGASPFTLSRSFAAVAGTTMHRYVVALRLAAALDALAQGANDLARLAADCGFAHHSHLTKTFGRAFGATPHAIRRRLGHFSPTPL